MSSIPVEDGSGVCALITPLGDVLHYVTIRHRRWHLYKPVCALRMWVTRDLIEVNYAMIAFVDNLHILTDLMCCFHLIVRYMATYYTIVHL